MSIVRSFGLRVLTALIAGVLVACTSSPSRNLAESSSGKTPTTTKPYNILMIAVDDLNNWVGAWGGPAYTPNIDRLAKEGVQFVNAYAVVPACNPSRVAVLTGQRPETTGQYTNAGNYRKRPGGADRVTLPQYLRRQQGYEAVAAGKIFHHPRGQKAKPAELSDDISWSSQAKVRTGTGGMEAYLDENGWASWLDGDAQYEGLPIKDYIRKHGIWGPIKQKKEQTGDWQTAGFCADYLQSESTESKPFLLACGIFRPHSPQLAPQAFFDMYPLDAIQLPEVPEDDMDDLPKIAKENWSTGFAKRVMSDTEEWKRAVQGYLSSTTFADAAIGRVLEALDASAHKDNTIVVFWSDHGFQLGHKDRWEKFSLWKQGANAPMVIKAPHMKQGTVHKPVSLLDIYPTVLELLGQGKNDVDGHTLDGVSLVPLMKKPTRDWAQPAVITYQEGNNSVMFEHWNFIRYQNGAEELYDHRSDPKEYNNIVSKPEHQALIRQLRKWLPQAKIKQDRYIPGG